MASLTNFTVGAINDFLAEASGEPAPATKKPRAKKAAPPPEPILTEGEQPDLVLPENA